MLRAMGGGDVKLMAAAGAIIGPGEWFTLFIFASVAGGADSSRHVACAKRIGRGILEDDAHFKELAHFRAPYKSQPDLDISSPQALTMPHGVAIAVGAVLLLISPALRSGAQWAAKQTDA